MHTVNIIFCVSFVTYFTPGIGDFEKNTMGSTTKLTFNK